MRDRREKTFEAVVGAVGRALSAEAGWKEDEGERVLNGRLFVRDLDSLLSLAVDLLFDTDEETGSLVLRGVVEVRCRAAQDVLDALDSPANAAIERILVTDAQEELAIELSPDLPVSDTARMVTSLVGKASTALAVEAGTVDHFLRCVAIDRSQVDYADQITAAVLAVSGRVEDARAVVARMHEASDAEFVERFTAWLSGDFVASDPVETPTPSWADARERVRARREALAVMERLGPSADLDARRAVLVAELSARGLEETPYWIERHATREPLKDAAGLTRLVRDAVRAFRSIGDDRPQEAASVAASGGGPWVRVTLAHGADATLDHAYKTTTRIGDIATVRVRLRSSDTDAKTRVALDGVEIGYLENTAEALDEAIVRAQIGRLSSSPPFSPTRVRHPCESRASGRRTTVPIGASSRLPHHGRALERRGRRRCCHARLRSQQPGTADLHLSRRQRGRLLLGVGCR